MPEQKQKSSNLGGSENLFIGLIIFVGLAVAYVLYSNSTSPSVDISLLPSAREAVDPKIETMNLDFSIFDHTLFKQLKIFGIMPVKPGQTGRENPFAPF